MSRPASELQYELDHARRLLNKARTRVGAAEHRKQKGEFTPKLAEALVMNERIAMNAAEIRMELLGKEFKRQQRFTN